MEQVKNNSHEPWYCSWNDTKMKPRRVVRNKRGAFVEAIEETMTAPELMDKIINSAWRNGEPGILFPDAANENNPVPMLGRLEATNPCGEQWLHDGDVCNLGSINLSKFVKNGAIDEERLIQVTRLATRMLDNVIDLSDFPVEKVNQTFRNNRRLGLGIMGFADMLYQLRIPYNSEEGTKVAEKVMGMIEKATLDYSETLANEKGCFPNWELSIFGPTGNERKQRNAAKTTVAPTGSISMLLDCSSGVEPFFALAYQKEVMGGQKLMYVNPHLKAELERLGLLNDEILEKIQENGSLQGIEEIPEETRNIYVTSMDISAEDHIRMQSAFQKHVDNSISKTVNFPNSATREDVRKGYVMAWELRLKGCTVYRDGSRVEQVLSVKSTKNNVAETTEIPSEGAQKVEIQSKEFIPPPVIESTMERDHDASFNKKEIIKSKKCPECSCTIQIAEGCMLCLNCGFSVCSV